MVLHIVLNLGDYSHNLNVDLSGLKI